MLDTNNPILKHKAGLPNLAEELGNVSSDQYTLSDPRNQGLSQKIIILGSIKYIIP